jgi:hypothetical protein
MSFGFDDRVLAFPRDVDSRTGYSANRESLVPPDRREVPGRVGRVWGGRPEAGLRVLWHEKIFRVFPHPFTSDAPATTHTAHLRRASVPSPLLRTVGEDSLSA